MKFGIFYEHQLPRPWTDGAEHRLFQEALDQVELADKLGIDYAWEVEHHFLEEYSHSSAPEIFLAACSQRTKRIRLVLRSGQWRKAEGLQEMVEVGFEPVRRPSSVGSAPGELRTKHRPVGPEGPPTIELVAPCQGLG